MKMSERRVIKMKKQQNNQQTSRRKKTEGEMRFAAAVLKMKENGTIKPKGQQEEHHQETEGKLEKLPEEKQPEEKQKGFEERKTQEHTPAETVPASSTKEKQMVTGPVNRKKKERFEDSHNRVTTYVSKKNHEKMKWLRKEYGIPLSETLNQALKEYFEKYSS
jgi:hypothetical protein